MKRRIAGLMVIFATCGVQDFAVADAPDASKPELLLVYWSSKDCRWCTYWESSWSGMESGLKSADEFRKLTYRVVKNQRLADPYTVEDYPPDIRWLKERMDRGEEKAVGRPGWAFYANKVRIAAFYGTKDWNSKTLPELKALVAKHSMEATPAAPGAAGQ
jgi:hypothetical protein